MPGSDLHKLLPRSVHSPLACAGKTSLLLVRGLCWAYPHSNPSRLSSSSSGVRCHPLCPLLLLLCCAPRAPSLPHATLRAAYGGQGRESAAAEAAPARDTRPGLDSFVDPTGARACCAVLCF